MAKKKGQNTYPSPKQYVLTANGQKPFRLKALPTKSPPFCKVSQKPSRRKPLRKYLIYIFSIHQNVLIMQYYSWSLFTSMQWCANPYPLFPCNRLVLEVTIGTTVLHDEWTVQNLINVIHGSHSLLYIRKAYQYIIY